MGRFLERHDGHGAEEVKRLTANDAVQFWQREAYYYEGRAGEQGASANRMVALGAGATAVLLFVANLLGNAALTKNPDLLLLLLVVPVVLFILWASAVRLLHEMHILRVYVRRAERELEKIAKTQPTLASYTRWDEHENQHDFTFFAMLVWFISAAALSLTGAFGITYAVVDATHSEFAWLALSVPINAFLILVFAAADTARDIKQIERKLGFAEEVVAPRSSWWLNLLGVGALSALLISAVVAAGVLLGDGAPTVTVLNTLAVFSTVLTVAGAVAGLLGRNAADKSLVRRASKVTVTVGLIGSIVAIGLASLHWFGL
jgi:hypothetical protein